MAGSRPTGLVLRGRGGLESITAKAVGDAAEAGDPLAREVLATTGRYLGRGWPC